MEEDNSAAAMDDQPPAKKKKEEDADAPADGGGDEKKAGAPQERTPELQKLWKAVEDDPADFTGWTYLLQHVDANATAEEAREAFDKFLHRYPYCYGYWKKYADMEKRKGTKENAMDVFERGVKAITLSVDLWMHFLNHVKVEYESQPDYVRALWERAVAGCGREWRSDKLWDAYVKWEAKDQNNPVNVIRLYDRIVVNPTQGLGHQFEMFKDFVRNNPPKDLLSSEEFLEMRKSVLEELKKGDEDASAPSQEEEDAAMREKITSSREAAFKQTSETSKQRWKYEDGIKRPYFHMKPLERGQLKNWREYLDYEIARQSAKEGGGDLGEVEILFERCLIACALYEEFWTKYAEWLETSYSDSDKDEKIRGVFERASTHHLPNKVDIRVKYAAFEERRANFDTAAEILAEAERRHPELLSLMLRRVNLERRRGNAEGVHQLYRSCIEKSARGKSKSDLSVKYSRFLRLSAGDDDAARKILEDALLEDEKNPKLYLQLLDIALHDRPLDARKVVDLLDAAMEKADAPKTKTLFSQRKVEFLEDFGDDVAELAKAQKNHVKVVAEAMEAAKKEAEAKKESEGSKSAAAAAASGGGDAAAAAKSNGTTTYAATNSATYGAHHTNQYQTYGSRYSSNYGAYYGGQGYPGYGGSGGGGGGGGTGGGSGSY